MSSALRPDSNQPMRLIGQVSRTFARLVDAPLRELGFSISQLPVLVTLKKAGVMSQGELARVARVEQPSMAQLLSRMERDELVQRVPDPADGRSRLISLSAQASSQLPKAKRVMDQTCNQALSGLTLQEQTLLLDLLLKVDANLNHALDQMLQQRS
ncbi:MarR family transcriptional regulator [Pseudomonas sp.]|uniref:MarR family winged helix-turn-helix transcriptional regulator n=1 Tax=Pseudomonas sp. TaxID=306 RepID=UPI00260881E6|nr:MarR family transcriptional regulator [Pseudomonas sp.]